MIACYAWDISRAKVLSSAFGSKPGCELAGYKKARSIFLCLLIAISEALKNSLTHPPTLGRTQVYSRSQSLQIRGSIGARSSILMPPR